MTTTIQTLDASLTTTNPTLSEPEQAKLDLIQMHLDAFVRLEIKALQRVGGPDDWQLTHANELAPLILQKADVFLFGGEKGVPGAFMGQLVNVLAVMAFVRGGVKAFGLHFEAIVPESEETAQ